MQLLSVGIRISGTFSIFCHTAIPVLQNVVVFEGGTIAKRAGEVYNSQNLDNILTNDNSLTKDPVMCLAVPLKLIEIHGNDAVGEAIGLQRSVRVDFIPEPKVGDYVMVHAGFAIERLPEEQALDDLEAWEELKDALA